MDILLLWHTTPQRQKTDQSWRYTSLLPKWSVYIFIPSRLDYNRIAHDFFGGILQALERGFLQGPIFDHRNFEEHSGKQNKTYDLAEVKDGEIGKINCHQRHHIEASLWWCLGQSPFHCDPCLQLASSAWTLRLVNNSRNNFAGIETHSLRRNRMWTLIIYSIMDRRASWPVARIHGIQPTTK